MKLPDAKSTELTSAIIGAAIEVHRHTGFEVGLLINFNESLLRQGVRRVVLTKLPGHHASKLSVTNSSS